METKPLNTIAMAEIAPEELAAAAGGTFTPNTYSKDMYHAIGISTSYHFFDRDEFRFGGESISYEEANRLVKMARMVHDCLNTGARGENVIKYDEKSFIRAFNSQLKADNRYPLWDGTKGRDF